MMQQEMTLARWLFNPFIRIAGTTSLVVGLVAILLGGLAAAVTGIRFDGLLDMHFVGSVPVWSPILEGLLNWIVIFVLFALVARLFGGGSGARLIDIAGTQALARAPLIPAVAIKSLHSQVRKAIRNKGHFPSDEAATKLIYLALRNITAKWKKKPPREWHAAKAQFAIQFGDRFVLTV